MVLDEGLQELWWTALIQLITGSSDYRLVSALKLRVMDKQAEKQFLFAGRQTTK